MFRAFGYSDLLYRHFLSLLLVFFGQPFLTHLCVIWDRGFIVLKIARSTSRCFVSLSCLIPKMADESTRSCQVTRYD